MIEIKPMSTVPKTMVLALVKIHGSYGYTSDKLCYRIISPAPSDWKREWQLHGPTEQYCSGYTPVGWFYELDPSLEQELK